MTSLIPTTSQGPAISSLLPALDPFSDKIATLISQQSDEGVQVAGLGKHGAFVQAVELVRMANIYVDDRFIINSEHGPLEEDERDDEERVEMWRNRITSIQQHVIRDQNTNAILRGLPMPLLVIDRPNPHNPTQTLLLAASYDDYRAAIDLQWSMVEVIVHPNIPDYDIHNLVTHIALKSSAPKIHFIFKQLVSMYHTWELNQHAPDSVQPPSDIKELAERLGCTTRYVRMLQQIYDQATARRLITQGMSIRTAMAVISKLKRKSALIDDALETVYENQLSRSQAEAHCQRLLKPQNASSSEPEPYIKLKKLLIQAEEHLKTHQSSLRITLGDEFDHLEALLDRYIHLIDANSDDI